MRLSKQQRELLERLRQASHIYREQGFFTSTIRWVALFPREQPLALPIGFAIHSNERTHRRVRLGTATAEALVRRGLLAATEEKEGMAVRYRLVAPKED